jgi:thymidylate synthase
MQQYLQSLEQIKTHGVFKGDRTGTGTQSLFGEPQMVFDLKKGFPMMTTKRVPFRWIAEELLWFLSGDTNEKTLREKGVDIWKEWADKEHCDKFNREEGDLGPVYGYLWRSFGGDYPIRNGVDQIARIIHDLKNNPNSRRHILSGWDPREADNVDLPPCHTLSQFYVANGDLYCKLFQRSADFFLGVPFNIASYALLTHMIAHVCDLGVGKFIHTFGDAHIYNNHRDQVDIQLARKPGKLPQLVLNPDIKEIDDFTFEDMDLIGYEPQGKIKAPVSV